MTGLANRLHFYDALSRALERGGRAGQTTGVVLADMDGFKAVNDTLGHNAGDQMIVEFGAVLRRMVLGSDVVGRLGGDEFAIVLHNIGDTANAEAVVGRIVAEMQHPVTVGGTSATMRASFGIAVCQPGGASADELMHRADLAMYQAKHRGATDWACYVSGMSQHQRGTDLGHLSASS
jgi:diguanylate cyclase (GGDEF)-like protein